MAIRGNIDFHGLQDVKRELARVSKRAVKAGTVGLYAVAVEIIKDAKTRAPVDTGALKESGYATMPNPNNRTIELGFGGLAQNYAIIQHENDEYYHKIGEAFYLLHSIEYILSFRGTATFARKAAEAFEHGKSITKEVPDTPWEGGE